MENTKENKAILFSQYYGQPVLRWHQWKEDTKNSDMKFSVPGVDGKGWFLNLKSLKDITDKDAYSVGILINCWSKSERSMEFFESDEMKDIHIQGGKFFAESIGKEWGKGLSHPFANSTTDILAAYDTLRSKGYALPFNNCMVEEQVKYGWIKLI